MILKATVPFFFCRQVSFYYQLISGKKTHILIQSNVNIEYIMSYSLLQIHFDKYHKAAARTCLIKLV